LTENDDKDFKSKVHHNIGNSYLKSQKFEESIKSYKEALKLNPNDEETKYNLSYALNMLKNNQDKQQQKNDQDKDDQKKNDDKNQDKKENDKNDQQKNDENKDKGEQNKPDQNQTTQQDNLKQPQQNKISKEEAERILNAMKNNEQDLQKKLRKQKGTVVKTEKDW
jgi:tetratricopeptide (TPR) repeat protein